jgi:hypothetical protein
MIKKTYLNMQAVSCVQMCVINYITSSVLKLKKEKTLRYPQSMEAKRKVMISVPSV